MTSFTSFFAGGSVLIVDGNLIAISKCDHVHVAAGALLGLRNSDREAWLDVYLVAVRRA